MKVFFLFFLVSNVICQNNIVDGMKQGDWVLLFPYKSDSLISERGVFIDDLEHGLWVRYYDNMMIREIVNYKHGQLDGLSFSFDKKGRIKSQEIYFNNKLDGLQLYYFDTGKIKSELN